MPEELGADADRPGDELIARARELLTMGGYSMRQELIRVSLEIHKMLSAGGQGN